MYYHICFVCNICPPLSVGITKSDIKFPNVMYSSHFSLEVCNNDNLCRCASVDVHISEMEQDFCQYTRTYQAVEVYPPNSTTHQGT